MTNGASGGLSGWTKELLSAAIAMDPSIANDLGIFLAEILSEHLDQIVADIFRASMLVALIKPSTVVDIRPIGSRRTAKASRRLLLRRRQAHTPGMATRSRHPERSDQKF
jgi:hypothetical protein